MNELNDAFGAFFVGANCFTGENFSDEELASELQELTLKER